jgi:integrase
MLDTPSQKTVLGLRDRTILSVGLQVGFRHAEIAGLTVGDFHMNRGYESRRVVRKGGKQGSLAMHPQAAQHIRDYRMAASFSQRSIGTCEGDGLVVSCGSHAFIRRCCDATCALSSAVAERYGSTPAALATVSSVCMAVGYTRSGS